MNGEPVRLALPRLPTVLPRLALGVAAMLFALRAPVVVVPVLALAAGWVLVRARDGAALRVAGWIGVATLAVTLLITPWIVVLAGRAAAEPVATGAAVAIAAAIGVRLACAAMVGVALAVALPPRAWFAALRRHPRLAVLFAVTFRQVPEIAADTARLRRVQRARGLLAGAHRLRPVVVLVPILTRSLERADRLGRALVLAGWGTAKARPLVVARYRLRDLGLFALALLLLVLVLVGGPWPLPGAST